MISSRGVLYWQAYLVTPYAKKAGKTAGEWKGWIFHSVPGCMGLCFWSTQHKIQGLNKAISKKMAAKFLPLNQQVPQAVRWEGTQSKAQWFPQEHWNWAPEKTQFFTSSFIHTWGCHGCPTFSLCCSLCRDRRKKQDKGQQDACKDTCGSRKGSCSLPPSFDRRLLSMLAWSLLFAHTWSLSGSGHSESGDCCICLCLWKFWWAPLFFHKPSLHTLNNEADVYFPSAVTGHPKPALKFLSSYPYSTCRKCAAGTQGQSCHFHFGCPRAAFPGHSLVTPFSPVRLFLAGGTLKFVLPTRAWVLKAKCSNPAAKLRSHKLSQTLCPQRLESSWVKGWSPGDPWPNTEGFYRDRACTGKQNSKS